MAEKPTASRKQVERLNIGSVDVGKLQKEEGIELIQLVRRALRAHEWLAKKFLRPGKPLIFLDDDGALVEVQFDFVSYSEVSETTEAPSLPPAEPAGVVPSEVVQAAEAADGEESEASPTDALTASLRRQEEHWNAQFQRGKNDALKGRQPTQMTGAYLEGFAAGSDERNRQTLP